MLGKQGTPDKVLLKVNQRLVRASWGLVARFATVRNGQVTLAGTLQRDNQRRAVLRAASGIDGVKQVVDQLKVQIRKTYGKG